MNFKKLTWLASIAMLVPTFAQAADVKVKIVNDERFQRQELVEIDVKDVRAKLGIDDMCKSSWNWQSKNPDGYANDEE